MRVEEDRRQVFPSIGYVNHGDLCVRTPGLLEDVSVVSFLYTTIIQLTEIPSTLLSPWKTGRKGKARNVRVQEACNADDSAYTNPP